MFLWVGRDAVPQLVMDVFDLPSYEALRGGKVNQHYNTHMVALSLKSFIADDIASVGQSIQPTCQRRCTEVTGDAPRCLLPAVIHRERRRGDATAVVGAEPPYSRSGRRDAELPTIR